MSVLGTFSGFNYNFKKLICVNFIPFEVIFLKNFKIFPGQESGSSFIFKNL